MSTELNNKTVAILATDGFEYVELVEPKKALEAAGAKTVVISPKDGQIKGWNHTDWGESVPVDLNLNSARESDFDALVLPGGVMNPDHLRQNKTAVAFVKSFFEAHKPVAAICHGPLVVGRGRSRTRKETNFLAFASN